MRSATPTSSQRPTVVGNPDAALAGAAKVVEAEYDMPFQGHTAFAPAHAMADPSNGQMTIYSNDMKSYGMRTGVAQFLGMPREQVRVVWMEGPQGYGRTAADDAGFEAAYLAKEIGRPVRVQWMRHEETAWDTKGPAFTFKMRGGLDAQGKLVALDYNAQSADYCHVGYNEADTVLIAQLMGARRATPAAGSAGTPSDMYEIPNKRTASQVVSLPLVWETPLRTGNLRDPNGPQITFAAESFIDEMAAAAKADPVEFRMRLLTAGTTDDSGFKRARSIAVVKAAAEAFGWDRASFTEAARHRKHSHRPRDRVRVPQPDRRRRDRRGRSESPDRSRVGEAARLRARLRAGHQPRGAAPHHRGRHAPLVEPRAPRGSAVRHREDHGRGLDLSSLAQACRRAGEDRRRAGERRSQSEPARPSSLWRRRDGRASR